MGWRGQVTTMCLAVVTFLAGCTRQGPPTAAPDTTATASQRQVPSPRAAAFEPVGERIGLFFGQVRSHMRADDRPPAGSYIRSALLSPDGKRLAYVAKVGDSEALVLDGTLAGAYRSVERPLFSPDGQHFACLAKRPSGKLVVVHDGNAGREFGWNAGESLTFSPDSRRLAFCANRGQMRPGSGEHGTWHVVVDGQEGPGYNEVHRLVFSDGGSRFAYAALKGAKSFGEMGWEGGNGVIVIDGE